MGASTVPSHNSVQENNAREQKQNIVRRLLAERQVTPNAGSRSAAKTAVTPSSSDRIQRLIKLRHGKLHPMQSTFRDTLIASSTIA